MPHGGPDWGTGGKVKAIYTIEDLGELAARLGSPVIFDRRGNVLWYDDFESGIEQWYRHGDVGYSVDWNGNYAETGGFSCKLTTGPVTNRAISIYKYIAIPIFSSLGMKASFSYKQNWKDLTLTMYIKDGTYQYYPSIRYDAVNYKLQYADSTLVYQDVPGGDHIVPDQPYIFDTIKFVADFTTAKYKRLIVSNQEFNLSDISFAKDTLVSSPRMYGQITLRTKTDADAIGYIDNAILTQNEP